MILDWLRFWPELIRINLVKARHRRRVRHAAAAGPLRPSPCQSSSDSGRPRETRCEACHRFDRAHRYRHVCPDLVFVAEEARCARDSAEVRPYWLRAAAQLILPLLAIYLFVGLAAWGLLRARGLDRLSVLDVLAPARWSQIAEHRRARFQDLAFHALGNRDPATASIALFSAAQTGRGDVVSNIALARLATLGGYHGLADQIHDAMLVDHPEKADAITVAWHDDLLIANRPAELARLSLARLAAPPESREFWLRAFFESIRHPGVAAGLLSGETSPAFPHPGLRFAVAARAALDRSDRAAAADQLIALAGQLPGQAARRFLVFSWLALADLPRARAVALSTAHPSPPGEISALAYALLQADRQTEPARAVLRPLFPEAALRLRVLAALLRDPDAELLREFASALPGETRSDPRLQVGLWLAACRCGAGDVAASAAEALAKAGQALPSELRLRENVPASREQLALVAATLPLERELLYALREAR